MQHVIVRSARPAPGGNPLQSGDWIANNAGLAVSKFFGFGLMDAGKMVHMAKHWNKAPQQQLCEIKGHDKNRFDVCGLFLHNVSHQVISFIRTL